MKPRCGAKWYKYTFCSNQPDVANPRKSPDLRLRLHNGSSWRQRLNLSINGKSEVQIIRRSVETPLKARKQWLCFQTCNPYRLVLYVFDP